MNQGFWMVKDSDPGCISDGEVNNGNSSRSEQKRSHQWFVDGAEAELFPNKKQAVGVSTNNLFTGMLNSNVNPWLNASSFQSIPGLFSERLFDPEMARTVNFCERSMPSISSGTGNMGRKLYEAPFGNDSSFGLSISHTLEDPGSCLNYGGIRKVKVSQVKEPENIMPLSMEHAFNRVDSNTMLTPHIYGKTVENTISVGLAYNKGDGSIMSIDGAYDRENSIFISMGQPYSKRDHNLPVSQAYKENNNTIAMGHTLSKGDNNIISMGQTYNADENTTSMGHMYSKGNDSTVSLSQTHNKDDNSNLSIGQSYSKGGSTVISFGGCDDDDGANPSGGHISSYELFIGQHSLRPEVIIDKELIKSDADALATTAHIAASGKENVSRKKVDLKQTKKVPPNNFPSNVRSLLATGMLDGVPVKYVAWSREKELRGVIKGSGYLCGCQTCSFSKVINAYEFERHANCKTKHPNNHIYFENGKTIYGIVQELRSTPQNMLFGVIQTITGSPINQKSFCLWKESFLAATRELQRIYGKDETKPVE